MKHKLLILLALALGLASNTRAEDVTISSAAELVAFASRVNAGETSLNATLTDDIDLTGQTWTPIGNSTNKYAGTFDGQGYAITNFEYTATSDNNGLFGCTSGAKIRNFSISGTLTSNGYTKNGVVGSASASTEVSGIHSSLTINVSNKNAHTGGIVGGDTGGTDDKTVVKNCEYSGTLNHSGTGDNQAGILGYTGYGSVLNCIFSGTINGETSRYGGILGYCKQPSFGGVQNCLSIGKITVSSDSNNKGAIIGTWNGNATSNVKNNYYCLKEGSNITRAIGGNTANCEAPHAVTASQLASGEVCYLLNGSQGGNSWRQNLASGTLDAIPTLDSTHERVYQFGSSYINDGTDVTIDDETDLQNFATIVNAGALSLNAILTDDIDMSTLASWTAIGDWGSTPNGKACFKGHFNGQGFAIKNFNFTASHNYYSIFGVISTGALIENLSVSGNISNTDKQYIAGVVAYARDENPTIRYVRSYVNLNSSNTKGRHGGILGGSLDGTVKIDNCSYFGELKVPDSGNFGGIVGYVNNSTSAFLDVTDCLFAGFIRYTDGVTSGSGSCGGIVGYNNAGYATIKNCLSLGDITTEVRGLIFGLLNGNNSKVYNCYYQGDYANYSTSAGTASPMETTAVSYERLESGEIAFLLNESVSGGTEWFQTLPDDSYPAPYDMGHAPVYMNGHQHCDGETYPGASYSNEDLGTITDPHDFVDGFCSYCNTLEENYITPIDGYYMIGTPAQLKWFAAFVNAGNQSANAKLANITPLDLTGVAVEPIGNSSAAYTGTFDGQGKSITGFSATSTGYGGLFGKINNATIKDFSISGSLTVNSGTGSGVIGWAENSSTITNVHSALVISVENSDVAHVGGVCGSLRKSAMNNCSFKGSLTETGGSYNCFGGVCGYANEECKIDNCANYGSVTFSNNACYAGGICGYVNNSSFSSAKNCLNIGTIQCSTEGQTATYGGAIIGWLRSTFNTAYKNNYWLKNSAVKAYGSKTNEANEVTTAQLASGEVAYKLGSAWYQTIGTDANPVLDSSREKVLYVGAAGYSTFYDADNDWALSSYNGDAKAFIGTLTPSGGALHLEEIDDIPAKTAVVIGGTYYNKVSTTATADATGNILIGSTGYTVPADRDIFALGIANNVVGFYPVVAGVNIPAGKAYLDLTDTAVKEFLTFVFDDATGINEELRMKNEESSEVIFNLAGQRLGKMQKGINIVNGKKIMVK